MERYIVFFDDICVLCSRSVQFIHRHDRKNRFHFASLDSEAFRKVAGLVKEAAAGDHASDPDRGALPDSVILFMNDKVYLRSAAALHIAARLRFPVSLLAVGWIIPPFIRNGLYDWIARNRYRWFGKRDSCFVPGGSLRDRVLE